jgi:hypothetical protein
MLASGEVVIARELIIWPAVSLSAWRSQGLEQSIQPDRSGGGSHHGSDGPMSHCTLLAAVEGGAAFLSHVCMASAHPSLQRFPFSPTDLGQVPAP